ncbi:MAG: hypothetical protein H6974_15190 [Gammaproteobacteria bacterium]|nr:hypothetical protein [Gammaproteobacteria bacterium]
MAKDKFVLEGAVQAFQATEPNNFLLEVASFKKSFMPQPCQAQDTMLADTSIFATAPSGAG